MARPERNNVDYFPFLCKEGKAIYYIEQTYGNDGYAAWIRILRQLAVTNYHYLDLNDKIEFMYLSSKCKVTIEVLSNIIQDLCDLGEFDKDMWINNKIIFSEKMVNSIKDAYNKRNNKCITLDGLRLLLKGLGSNKLSNGIKSDTCNTQSKVEYSKVEKKRVESLNPIEKIGKEDVVKFVDWFNSIADRKFTATKKVQGMFKARLDDYTKSQIQKAVQNAHSDKYHIESNFKDLTPEFILRPEKLEKFLNVSDKKNSSEIYTEFSNKIDHSNRD